MGSSRRTTAKKERRRLPTTHRRQPAAPGSRLEGRSGGDAVQLRDDGHERPLEVVQSVLPVLLVVVQIRIHSGSLPRDGLTEVDSRQQIGLPAALVAVA